MKVAIQRRGIYLEPLRSMELLWVSDQLATPEIAESFAIRAENIPQWHFRKFRREGRAICGTIRRAATTARIGFVIMFAPDELREYWEIGAAIPDKFNRDAFSMLHAVDLVSHYMFDHLKVSLCGARVAVDNRASEAVARRIGHRQLRREEMGGKEHIVYVLDQDDWARRRDKLEARERERPSGIGGAFITLPGPPWNPVVVEDGMSTDG